MELPGVEQTLIQLRERCRRTARQHQQRDPVGNRRVILLLNECEQRITKHIDTGGLEAWQLLLRAKPLGNALS